MKRRILIFVIATMAIVVCVCYATLGMDPVRRFIDDVVYDNRNHYLPCDQLPADSDVQRIVAEHSDAVNAILRVNPGQVGLEIDTTSCPGKADILVWYGSREDRQAIEAIIDGETFFGVPYRLRNV